MWGCLGKKKIFTFWMHNAASQFPPLKCWHVQLKAVAVMHVHCVSLVLVHVAVHVLSRICNDLWLSLSILSQGIPPNKRLKTEQNPLAAFRGGTAPVIISRLSQIAASLTWFYLFHHAGLRVQFELSPSGAAHCKQARCCVCKKKNYISQ